VTGTMEFYDFPYTSIGNIFSQIYFGRGVQTINHNQINIDPESYEFLMETNLPTSMTARVELLIYQRVNNRLDSPFC
jgi:hypothetical protein